MASQHTACALVTSHHPSPGRSQVCPKLRGQGWGTHIGKKIKHRRQAPAVGRQALRHMGRYRLAVHTLRWKGHTLPITRSWCTHVRLHPPKLNIHCQACTGFAGGHFCTAVKYLSRTYMLQLLAVGLHYCDAHRGSLVFLVVLLGRLQHYSQPKGHRAQSSDTQS